MNGLPLFSSTPLCGTSLTTPMMTGQSPGCAGRPPKLNFPPTADPFGDEVDRCAGRLSTLLGPLIREFGMEVVLGALTFHLSAA